MRRVTVEVTAEDIAMGKRALSCLCPIALACERIGAAPVVGRQYLNITFDGKRHTRILMPHEAEQFVKSFDNGETVRPLTFELELP